MLDSLAIILAMIVLITVAVEVVCIIKERADVINELSEKNDENSGGR